jgi:hypothetical protein
MNEFAIEPRRKGKTAIWLWLMVGCGVLALFAANAHLVYVASSSQPGCVSHLRQGDAGDAPGLYRAAKSACSPAANASAEGIQR